MPNWINLSDITGSGNSTVNVTASALNDICPRVASYKVYAPDGKEKIVNITQMGTNNFDELTGFYNVTVTGRTGVAEIKRGTVSAATMSIDGGSWTTISLTQLYNRIYVNFATTGVHYIQYRFEGPSDEVPYWFFAVSDSSSGGNSDIIGVVVPDKYRIIKEDALQGQTNLKFAILNEGLTEIGNSAFSRNLSLKGISLPSSLRNIGDLAFERSGLANIAIPEGVLSIGNEALKECENLVEVYIPNTVTTIGRYCFSDCYNMNSVHLSTNLIAIPERAFNMDGTLQDGRTYTQDQSYNLQIPDSVEVINQFAFYNNQNIKNLVFGRNSNLRYLSRWCFDRCTAWQRITIPSGVTGIECVGSLSGGSLTEIYAYPTVPPTYIQNVTSDVTGPFRDLPPNGILHYPAGSDYSSWLSNTKNYPGYYGWTGVADL